MLLNRFHAIYLPHLEIKVQLTVKNTENSRKTPRIALAWLSLFLFPLRHVSSRDSANGVGHQQMKGGILNRRTKGRHEDIIVMLISLLTISSIAVEQKKVCLQKLNS